MFTWSRFLRCEMISFTFQNLKTKKLYFVHGFAKHEKTQQLMVLYSHEYDPMVIQTATKEFFAKNILEEDSLQPKICTTSKIINSPAF
jgi:imidazoleglycerol phosphate synthase glutamine amidotransferase subunit HisH